MKIHRGILIDPEKQVVTVVDTDASHSSMEELIGARSLDNFRVADHETSWDYGWIDDQGLNRGEPIHGFLLSEISKNPFAGRCLLIGALKETGETCAARFPLDYLRSQITWLGLIKPEVIWEETEHAIRAIVLYEKIKVQP